MRRCVALAVPGARRALTPLLRPPHWAQQGRRFLQGLSQKPQGLPAVYRTCPGAPTGAVKGDPGGVSSVPVAVPRAPGAGLLHSGAPAQRDTWRLASSSAFIGWARRWHWQWQWGEQQQQQCSFWI